MATPYFIPVGVAHFEQEIKRSRFIARIRHIETAAQARQWFVEVSDEYPDARHICWAYIAGAPNTTEQSMSDAGEPPGTAGKPMLNVLQHSNAGEIAAVVVRYFGGVKLGTGGLVRAYSSSVVEALKLCRLIHKTTHQRLDLVCAFADEHALRYLLEKSGGELESINYGNKVHVSCMVPEPGVADFLQRLPHSIEQVET